MRLARMDGRVLATRDGQWFDVESLSEGRFGNRRGEPYERWDEFVAWMRSGDGAGTPVELDPARLDCPVPLPRQVMAIGLNYRDHAHETERSAPEHPVVFTKFASSLAGPGATIELPSTGIDWEVELVVVIGREARQVTRDQAWGHVAGLTIGQDLSWREVQNRGPAPQFSLAKSYPGFSPIGPVVVTPDEFANPDDLEISCTLDDEVLQHARTRDLIFSVSDLVSLLSEALTLYPGDLIFTGTPAGVGFARTPPRFLVPGQLHSQVEGIGKLTVNLVQSAGH